MGKSDPASASKLTAAQQFMDERDLTFENGVLYEKSGWLNGTLTEVTNPAFMNVEGMKMLQDISRGLAGSLPSAPQLPLLGNAATPNAQGVPVDYSAFSVRPVGTPSSTTVTAPPVTSTNNAVNARSLNSVTQPALADPRARRAGETETSYRQRLFREYSWKDASAFLAGR